MMLYAYFHVIDVRIYAEQYLKEVQITVLSGSYEIYDDNKLLFIADINNNFNIVAENKKLHLKYEATAYHSISKLTIISKKSDGIFYAKPFGKFRARAYDDNLTVSNENGYLKLINNVDIEKYVAGVVEAEVGAHKNIEFYKVQAVACRTYVLRNIKRHLHENYHVCDKVHCQVYNGKTYNADILTAVEQTKHFVIIDKELNFISAVFHSNCGGQTVNSEHVWTLSSTYLKSIKDTFCIHSKNAIWEFRIKKQDFLNYLERTFKFPVQDSNMVEKAINFSQENGRRVYFLDMPHIHLKIIRADLKLKSTFFSIYPDGDLLIFKGRGFGHGVGLCQEGAMHMIDEGYCYDDIIKFYYTNVYIVSYEDILKLNE